MTKLISTGGPRARVCELRRARAHVTPWGRCDVAVLAWHKSRFGSSPPSERSVRASAGYRTKTREPDETGLDVGAGASMCGGAHRRGRAGPVAATRTY